MNGQSRFNGASPFHQVHLAVHEPNSLLKGLLTAQAHLAASRARRRLARRGMPCSHSAFKLCPQGQVQKASRVRLHSPSHLLLQDSCQSFLKARRPTCSFTGSSAKMGAVATASSDNAVSEEPSYKNVYRSSAVSGFSVLQTGVRNPSTFGV